MNHVTRATAEEILGALDDNTFIAIEATGARLADIIEAKSLADGTSDIAGGGERVIAGPTKEVLTIISGRKR